MTGNDTPLVRVWLLGKFLVKRRKDDGTWETIANTTWANSYARPLLKRLLSAMGRRAAKSALLDDLWPESDLDDFSQEEESREKRREKYLSDAASKLRQVLHREIIQPLGSHGAGGYELAGPSLLQSDIDECEQLIIQAERGDLSPAEAFSWLEKAGEYFKRGGMLEGEDGEWCVAIRTRQEEMMRYCFIKLAEGYEAQKKLWQAIKHYQWLFEVNPIDEDALCRLLGMLHRHGMLNHLRTSYEEAQKRFETYQLPLSVTTKKLFEHLMQSPPSFAVYLTPPREIPRPSESETAPQPDPSLAQTYLMTYNENGQLSSPPRLEMLGILMGSRRQAFSDILNVAFASFALSPYVLLSPESREHLELMMTHSSYVDDRAIGLLAGITQNYWSLREQYAAIDLLDGIKGHFQTIIQLLRESRPTDIYNKLGALASETAQLLGQMFHEIREFGLAWHSYAFSLKMAQEINDADLWGSGVARLAELLIYWGEPQEALPFLEDAHKRGIRDQRLLVQLSSLEAEIYARTGKMEKFLEALEPSKNITLPVSLTDDRCRTGFNPSVAKGYEGACLMRLHKPELASPALNEAFATYDPTSIRRRSYLLANLGRVHGQLGDVKKACELLLESLGIAAQTKSLITLQRVYQGRDDLDLWKDSADVKELDQQIVQVYKSLAKVKERV